MDLALDRAQPGDPDGVARYIRLASVLRHRIDEGHWKPGDRLPTVAGLAQQLGIARVTVRHAYQILAREGLITSGRGRGTFVESATSGARTSARIPIDHPFTRSENVRFLVLSRDLSLTLPPDLAGDSRVRDSYTRIRKVHQQDGEPFVLMAIYIPRELYRRLPRRSEGRMRIMQAMLAHGVNFASMRQVMTVVPADESVARHLGCRFAAPTAYVQRRILDDEGFVAYASHCWYRGDRFITTSEMPFDLWAQYPGYAKPEVKPPRRG